MKKHVEITNLVLFFGLILLAWIPLVYNGIHAWFLIIPIILIGIYFFKQTFSLFSSSLFWIILFLVLKSRFFDWPINFIIPVLAYFIITFSCKSIKKETHWFSIGRINKISLLLILLTVVISSLALIVWVIIFKPDLSDVFKMVPDYSMGLLLLAGVGFAIGNAILEEIMFRGILWDGFEKVCKNIIVIVLLQAVFFGIMHYNGFPRGIAGVILASIYGILQGIIRHFSKGLLAPVVSHFFADLTIFLILLKILEII